MAFFRTSETPSQAKVSKDAGDRRRQQLQAQQQMLDKRKADAAAGPVQVS